MEYKFRGLGLYSKKWVYGNLIHMDDAEEGYKDVIIPIEDNCTYVDNDDGYGVENWHKVDSKTVGISTGVKDINKKDAYLGDILKDQITEWSSQKDKEKAANSFGIVKKEVNSNNLYIEWNFRRKYQGEYYWDTNNLPITHIKQYEVVGNIFENKDMIKKEV